MQGKTIWKHIDVDIQLGIMVCVTGVYGYGKSSLVNEILYKKLARRLNRSRIKPGLHDHIIGYDALDKVINIDQSPMGRTPRSNPARCTGVFDMIRDLFANTKDAKARGYKKKEDFPLMYPAEDVKHAAGMELLRSRCIFFRMYMFHVKCAVADAIIERHWK